MSGELRSGPCLALLAGSAEESGVFMPVRPPAGCKDPVASSLARPDIGGCGFFSFCPRALALRTGVRDHPLDPRGGRPGSASPRRASPAPRGRGYVGSVLKKDRQGGGKGKESKLQQQNSAARPASLLLVHHGGVGARQHAGERRLELSPERPILPRRPARRTPSSRSGYSDDGVATLRRGVDGARGNTPLSLLMISAPLTNPPLLSNSPELALSVS